MIHSCKNFLGNIFSGCCKVVLTIISLAVLSSSIASAQEATFGLDGGKGYPHGLLVHVEQLARQQGLPGFGGSSAAAFLQSEGGSGWDATWVKGAEHFPTLRKVCDILGYRTYVRSTCQDFERSGRYPNGKCNFHSPDRNDIVRFDESQNKFNPEHANPKYGKTFVATITCRDPKGVDPDPTAKVKLTKTGPEFITRGGTATYTVTATNLTNTTLTGVGVGDRFINDPGFVFLAGQSTPGCSSYQQDGVPVFGCVATTLGPKESKVYSFTFKVPNNLACNSQVMDQADVEASGSTNEWVKFISKVKCEDKPQCSDGIDNDGDGWIDLDDSGCDGPNDDDETNKPQCKDGKDNDGDGKIDFPNDPGCDSPTDNDERDIPACKDGKDNDGDGKIDMADPGCENPNDDDETDKPDCKDGKDNDGDGKIDFPQDPGCDSPTDDDEQDKPQCKDGKDNDGDGKIDFPNDPGCDSPHDNDEYNRKPQCQDGIDNDGDGWVDLDDSGCDGPNDDDETNKPQCKDGKDNDHDGKIDFPQDPGCDSPHDNDETDKPQCKDGKDNDGDGKTDFPNDPGCDNEHDDDEWNHTLSPILPIGECVYNLGNGKYRAYFGYENTGSQVITVQAVIQSANEINIFTPGEANRGQVSTFAPGRSKATFFVEFDGNPITWKVQPQNGALKTITVSKNSLACKPVKPIAECRDKKAGGKFLTYFGYQNDNQFEIKLNIPSLNKFAPSPEDRGQQDTFITGRVVNAFSVTSDSDITWRLAEQSATSNASLPACTANTPPSCGSQGAYIASCQGTQTRVTLNGGQASDPEGDTLTYKWSTDCAGGTITDPNAANPDLVLNTASGTATTCGIWLVLNDGVNPAVTCDQAVKVSACNTDCLGTPNGTAKLDQCGVCNGNNACVDCKGIPNGGVKVDKCGVCGGTNACVDCAGNANGTSKLDQCGVCNGTGRTCLQCTSSDITNIKLILDVAVADLKNLILKLTNRLQTVTKNNPKFNKAVLDARKESEVQYQQAWTTIWVQFPNVIVNCTNSSVCQESDLSVSINAYTTGNTRLRDIALGLLRTIQAQRAKSDKSGLQADKKLVQQVNSMFSNNTKVLATVPRFTSQCQ